jgi:hypothetical protein
MDPIDPGYGRAKGLSAEFPCLSPFYRSAASLEPLCFNF